MASFSFISYPSRFRGRGREVGGIERLRWYKELRGEGERFKGMAKGKEPINQE